MKNTKAIIISVVVLGVVLIAGVLIYPNYRNDISTSNEPATTGSTSLRFERDLDEYTRIVPTIVIGTFTKQGGTEYGGDKTFIYTNLYFSVEEVLKGDVKPGDEIVIKKYGGELNGERAIKDDGVQYREGERDVLFLGTNEDGNYVVFAGDYGQFPVDTAGRTTNFNDQAVSVEDFKSEITSKVQ